MSIVEAGSRRWFMTLFLTDMWERFGFYGMQAILALYATASPAQGGLGLPKASAAALFGAYLGLTFLVALPGGWLGDRILGQQRAVLWGAGVITAGYAVLALPVPLSGAVGLALVAIGGGLFKPNQQALLNMKYGTDRARREGAVSAFYIGIQVSALVAPLATGYLGERVSWHLAFAVSTVAMSAGVLTFAVGRGSLGEVGASPGRPAGPTEIRRYRRRAMVALVLTAAGLVAAFLGGVVTAVSVIAVIGLLVLTVPGVAYVRFSRHPRLDAAGHRRLRAFGWLFLGSSVFWMLAGQTGSVLTLFAKHSIRRETFGFTIPASWLQAAVPLFILVLAPVFAWHFPRLGARVPVPVKFAAGLAFAGVSFLLMTGAAALAGGGHKVSALWLLGVFFLLAVGEILIGVVAISATADAVPHEFLGQTLGLWWLFAALGGGLGGLAGRLEPLMSEPVYFAVLGLVALAFGVLTFLRRARIESGLAARTDAGVAVTDTEQAVSEAV